MSAAPQPEQTFFADPAIDRLLGFAMTLATEVWVLRDRLAALEGVLAAHGVIERGAVDAAPPGDGAGPADRTAFVGHLMDNLLGKQASQGAPDDLLARFGDRPH